MAHPLADYSTDCLTIVLCCVQCTVCLWYVLRCGCPWFSTHRDKNLLICHHMLCFCCRQCCHLMLCNGHCTHTLTVHPPRQWAAGHGCLTYEGQRERILWTLYGWRRVCHLVSLSVWYIVCVHPQVQELDRTGQASLGSFSGPNQGYWASHCPLCLQVSPSITVSVRSLTALIVRYFVDDTRALQDHMTVELLYLQSRQAIVKVLVCVCALFLSHTLTPSQGDILTDEATVFELAACAMQAQCGDYRR